MGMNKADEVLGFYGTVVWELIDEKTGILLKCGKARNSILNFMRNDLADMFIGVAITPPTFIGIATGTGEIGAADVALDTPVDYDGSNEAKVVDSKSLLGLYTSRLVVQFSTTEANQNVRQIGLFDAANSGNLWCKFKVSVNKTTTERLNIYWYITWERKSNLAIKTGTSIAATGTITADADSTLTFASAVTSCIITNNTAEVIYIKLNGAMSGTPPTGWDYLIPANSKVEIIEEQFQISTLHVYKELAGNITLPDNEFSAVGW